ncbi:hypothetical protein EV421DRAFT_1850152, partial [Armillaria borealis]
IPRCSSHALSRQPLDSPTLAVHIDRRAFTLAGGTSSHRLARYRVSYCRYLRCLSIVARSTHCSCEFLRTYMLSLVRLPRLYGYRRLPPLIFNGDTSRSPRCLFSRLRTHNSCAQIPRIKEVVALHSKPWGGGLHHRDSSAQDCQLYQGTTRS